MTPKGRSMTNGDQAQVMAAVKAVQGLRDFRVGIFNQMLTQKNYFVKYLEMLDSGPILLILMNLLNRRLVLGLLKRFSDLNFKKLRRIN